MEIGIAAFRAELRRWLNDVAAGEEIIITDRGAPVARLTGIHTTEILARLVADGTVELPQASSRHKATRERLVTADGSVSEIVSRNRN